MLETRDRGPQKPCVSRFEVVGGVVVMSVSCFGERVVVGNKKDPSITQNASGRGAGRLSLISCSGGGGQGLPSVTQNTSGRGGGNFHLVFRAKVVVGNKKTSSSLKMRVGGVVMSVSCFVQESGGGQQERPLRHSKHEWEGWR